MASGSSRGSRKASDGTTERLEITGRLDAHSVEALRLEIEQVVRSYGIAPEDVRVEIVDPPGLNPRRRARPR